MRSTALAYTRGGVLTDHIKALRETGERVQIRSLFHFDGIAENGFSAVFLEIDNQRIRNAYETANIPVTVFSEIEKTDTQPKESHGLSTRGRKRKI